MGVISAPRGGRSAWGRYGPFSGCGRRVAEEPGGRASGQGLAFSESYPSVFPASR